MTVTASAGFVQIDRTTARQIANDVVADLRAETEALSQRDADRAAAGASGTRLQVLWQQIRAAGSTFIVPEYDIDRVRVGLEPGEGQGPPLVVATFAGTVTLATYAGSPPVAQQRSQPAAFEGTFELEVDGGRYLIVRSRGASTDGLVGPPGPRKQLLLRLRAQRLPSAGFASRTSRRRPP